MALAARALPDPGGLLVLYGPYREADVPLAPSNAAFDDSLKARDPAWGLRELDEVVALAKLRAVAPDPPGGDARQQSDAAVPARLTHGSDPDVRRS